MRNVLSVTQVKGQKNPFETGEKCLHIGAVLGLSIRLKQSLTAAPVNLCGQCWLENLEWEFHSSRGPKGVAIWILSFFYDGKLDFLCKNLIFVSEHGNRTYSVLSVSLKRCDLRNQFILNSITFPSGKLFS